MGSDIRALPPRQRTVIVLRYYEDLHEDQIAATMGSALGTVKSLASRALSTLRRDAATFIDVEARQSVDRPDRHAELPRRTHVMSASAKA